MLDIRAQASKAQDAFAENFENYMDGKISKEQFSENAIPIRENMKRLEAEEREQREVIIESLVRRIVVGVEHAFTVEYKFDFGE